jgi:DNA-binding protein HU-beta
VTKQDFVDAVADRAGMSKRDASAAVDAVLDCLTDALKKGDSVTFTGFGKFSTSARAARTGVNPRTGERVQIQATTVPKFTAGSALKSAVRGG